MELYLIRHGECYPSAPQYYDLNNKAMNYIDEHICEE